MGRPQDVGTAGYGGFVSTCRNWPSDRFPMGARIAAPIAPGLVAGMLRRVWRVGNGGLEENPP